MPPVTVVQAEDDYGIAASPGGRRWLLHHDQCWKIIGTCESASEPTDYRLFQLTPPANNDPYYTLHLFPAQDIPGEWVAVVLDWDVVTQGSSSVEALESGLEAFQLVREADLQSEHPPRQPSESWPDLRDLAPDHGVVLLTDLGQVHRVLAWPDRTGDPGYMRLLNWALRHVQGTGPLFEGFIRDAL
jgi:predicted RNase H-like HicB family nuclease